MRVISRPSSAFSSSAVAVGDQIDQVLVQRLLCRVGVRRLYCRHRPRPCCARAWSHTSAEMLRHRSPPSASPCRRACPPIRRPRCAAPASVPGAIAATSADSRRKNPAEPARAPDGATYTITGTRERRMAPDHGRASNPASPPGVSISISSACAPSELAPVERPRHFIRAHRLNGVVQNQLVHNGLRGRPAAAPAPERKRSNHPSPAHRGRIILPQEARHSPNSSSPFCLMARLFPRPTLLTRRLADSLSSRFCPVFASICRSRSCAARFAGSSFSASPASVLASSRLPAAKSSCASTRYASAEGPSSSAACASLRAASASPLRSRTSASPACASCALRHRRPRLLIQPLRLQQQPAVQKTLCLRAERLRPIARRQRRQPPGIHLVQHRRRLPEGRCIEGAHNPLQRIGIALGSASRLARPPSGLPFHASSSACASLSLGRSFRHCASSFMRPATFPCRFRLTARLKW